MSGCVPRFILTADARGERDGVLTGAALFVDISGFTRLTGQLMEQGMAGAEVLAETLRYYFDPLVAAVDEAGGFISGFAGDAFTAVFPARAGEPVADRVLAAAGRMQGFFGEHPVHRTRYGEFPFAVKIGLTWGEAEWGIVDASPDAASYYFAGPAIDGAAAVEHHHAEPGDICFDAAFRARLLHWQGEAEEGGAFRTRGAARDLASDALAPARAPGYPAKLGPAGSGEEGGGDGGRFLPPGLAALPAEGEFRIVTSVFLSFGETPDVRELIRAAHRLTNLYGGTFTRADFGDKGGNFLIFFGAPVAHENDPERAFDFALELFAQQGGAIALRAGITRDVRYVGFNGGVRRREFACLGRATNLAARLMMKAPAEELWCDERSVAAGHGAYVFEDRGRLPFKGFPAPLPVQRLVRKRAVADRTFRARALVGREEELAAVLGHLQPVFDGGLAGVVYVDGEPGLGKSYLVETARRRLAEDRGAEAFLWVDARCDETLRRSFNPFVYALKVYASQAGGRTEEENRVAFDRALEGLVDRLRQTGSALGDEVDRLRSVLAALVGLHYPGSLYDQLDPKLRYENTGLALRAWLHGEAALRPVIVHLEDGHVADESSREALAGILRSAEGVSLAVVATCRPADDGTRHRFACAPEEGERSVRLRPLPGGVLEGVARGQLGRAPAPALVRLLEERAEGNPFFAEQILTFLSEQGALVEGPDGVAPAASGLVLPDGVNALLVARLDRLAAPVREVVQAAAVLGREFAVPVLRALVGDGGVEAAVEAGAVQRLWSAVTGERYSFAHALLRDAAYDMQARARLRGLHARAGEALESVHAGGLEPYYGELAHHYEHAEVGPRAIEYLGKAGDLARGDYRNAEAIDYYQRLRRWLGDAGVARADCDMKLGSVFELVGRWPEAQGEYERAVGMAADLRDLAREGAGRSALGNLLRLRGEPERGREELERAVACAQTGGDAVGRARALSCLGSLHRDSGRPVEARTRWAETLAIYRGLGDRAAEAEALSLLAVVEQERGDLEHARRLHDQALALQRLLGNRRQIGLTLVRLGGLYWAGGEVEQARSVAEEARTIFHEIGDRRIEAAILCNLGMTALQAGKLAAACRLATEALAIGREMGDQRRQIEALLALSEAAVKAGRPAEARHWAGLGLALSQAVGDPRLQGLSLYLLADVCHEEQRFAEARELYLSSLARSREAANRSVEASTIAALATVAALTAKADLARQLFEEAVEVQRAVGDRANIPVTLAGLAWVLDGLGQVPERVVKLLGEAQQVARAVGDPLILGQVLCRLAQIELRNGRQPDSVLAELRRIARAVGVTPQSQLARAIADLERATGLAGTMDYPSSPPSEVRGDPRRAESAPVSGHGAGVAPFAPPPPSRQ